MLKTIFNDSSDKYILPFFAAAPDARGELTLFSYMKYVGCMFMSKISYPTLDVVWKLAAATVGFVILLKVTADGKCRFFVFF